MSYILPNPITSRLCIVGLGYVGLPLALHFAQRNKNEDTFDPNALPSVIGYDISKKRIDELKNSYDRTKEIDEKTLRSLSSATLYTTNSELLSECDIFIVTVPTPIDDAKKPNLQPLESSCIAIGKAIKSKFDKCKGKGSTNVMPLIIFESTVYPGATEEFCVPILEQASGFIYNNFGDEPSFVCGYSPERINPGDKERTLKSIKKVTSGCCEEVAAVVDDLYKSIVEAGTFKAKSIKVAEAAKVIENTQRDLNIALVNELAMIFDRLSIDTLDVLEAAKTKWNFIPFYPGLVGGHCIGVDPYYLTYKAEQVGYYPQVVLSGRRINDGMSYWLADKLILEMVRSKINLQKGRILVCGITFKEDCPDIRNTRVADLVKHLKKYDLQVDIVDPWANNDDLRQYYELECIHEIDQSIKYDAIIAAVAHRQFKELTKLEWKALLKENGIILDIKGFVPRDLDPLRL